MTNYFSCTKTQRKLVDLFNDLFTQPFTESYYHTQFSKKSWAREDTSFEFNLNKLNITEDINVIETIYNEMGVIVLRKYNGEKYCTIGCGNKPLANCGGYPFEDMDEETEYHKKHHHTGHYTINPEPAYNPSVIGFFSEQEFKCIPDNAFIEIHSEGILLDGTVLYFSESERMLKNGGKLICDGIHIMTKKNDKLVTEYNIELLDHIRI
jgi:hypothetical protein